MADMPFYENKCDGISRAAAKLRACRPAARVEVTVLAIAASMNLVLDVHAFRCSHPAAAKAERAR
jgi:hypothetical protein